VVSRAFNNTIQNSYDRASTAAHYLESAQAKFVLCPSGKMYATLLLLSHFTPY
jgi:hypothetical protein